MPVFIPYSRSNIHVKHIVLHTSIRHTFIRFTSYVCTSYGYSHKPDTLSPEWFARLWGDDHNARVHCDCLRDVDFSKWKQ